MMFCPFVGLRGIVQLSGHWSRRQEAGGGMQEAGGRRQEAGVRRQDAGGWRLKAKSVRLNEMKRRERVKS
jgi:hypothetical protein